MVIGRLLPLSALVLGFACQAQKPAASGDPVAVAADPVVVASDVSTDVEPQASAVPVPAGSIGANVRVLDGIAFLDAAYPCADCNPPPLQLGKAKAARVLRALDLEGPPLTFDGRAAMVGPNSIEATAVFPAVLCAVDRADHSLLAVVSLRDRKPQVLYAAAQGFRASFVSGKKPVLDLRGVEHPALPPGFTGMPPHPRTLPHEFDGQLYINVGNDRGGPTDGPSIEL
jgi:hypothetical protein